MSNSINNMQNGENTTFLFYMSEGHYLVVFDMGQNQKSGIFERPAACFGKSCLVICREDNSPDSCKNPESIKFFEFDEINTRHSSKIVTATQGEYVDLSLEIINNTLTLNEV